MWSGEEGELTTKRRHSSPAAGSRRRGCYTLQQRQQKDACGMRNIRFLSDNKRRNP